MTRALLELARDGRDERTLAGRLCRACVISTDVDGAAVSLMTASEHRETLAASDTTAATVEDLQFTLGEGVCLEAAATGRPVLVPDLHVHELTTRWPVFAAAVAEKTDVRALFALPLQVGAINLGVLGLYRTTAGSLRGPELRDVVAAADAATQLLLGTQLRADTDPHGNDGREEDGLRDDRAEVHQATGMVLAQLDIPAQDALVRLRAHAFAQSRPLGEVARDVVARRLVFTEHMA